MSQLTRIKLEEFLTKEGYKPNPEICTDAEKQIYTCWFKAGKSRIKVPKKSVFESSLVKQILPTDLFKKLPL